MVLCETQNRLSTLEFGKSGSLQLSLRSPGRFEKTHSVLRRVATPDSHARDPPSGPGEGTEAQFETYLRPAKLEHTSPSLFGVSFSDPSPFGRDPNLIFGEPVLS